MLASHVQDPLCELGLSSCIYTPCELSRVDAAWSAYLELADLFVIRDSRALLLVWVLPERWWATPLRGSPLHARVGSGDPLPSSFHEACISCRYVCFFCPDEVMAGMAGLEVAIISLGAALVKGACKVWLGDNQFADDVSSEVVDLFSQRVSSRFDQRKIGRFFDLRQRVDAVQRLALPGPFPVREDLVMPEPRPFPDEVQRAGVRGAPRGLPRLLRPRRAARRGRRGSGPPGGRARSSTSRSRPR
jgi:hypothetical protein